MELLPDSSDPSKEKQAEGGRVGCGGEGEMRSTQTETDQKMRLQATSLATLGKESEEGGGGGGEGGGERGEKASRDDEGVFVPRDGARFAQQGGNEKLPEPSTTGKGGAAEMGDACATPPIRRSTHPGRKSTSGHALPRDDGDHWVGKKNTQSGVDHLGVDALIEEPMRIKNGSSVWSRDSPLYVKKARREEDGFEGAVPDPKVMNSGGFFR